MNKESIVLCAFQNIASTRKQFKQSQSDSSIHQVSKQHTVLFEGLATNRTTQTQVNIPSKSNLSSRLALFF